MSFHRNGGKHSKLKTSFLFTIHYVLTHVLASKRKNVPIGSTLFEMGLISLDQLKNVLHDQSGYDLVSAEQLVNQKKFVNILPEDFIRANKVIPISSDGKTLVLGVVKPINKNGANMKNS